MTTFFWAFRQESSLLCRQWHHLTQPLILFVLMAVLFPLSLPQQDLGSLQIVASGVIWITALLSVLMGLERLFLADYQSGLLEQYVLAQRSLTSIVLAKIMTFWLSNGFLIALFSPVVGYGFGLSTDTLCLLFISLVLGTLTLSLIDAVGAALTLTSRRGYLLIALLVLPLYIPVIIFGAGATSSHANQHGGLYFLSALLVMALVLCPIAIRLIFENTLD